MTSEVAQPPRLCFELSRRDTERRGESSISIKADVVDTRFARLNAIHYLLEVLVLDL